jgi:surface polysaccharide O-acyltransferase-like enzyme
LIIKAVPAWSFANQPMSVVIQILFGQADYQLYFLPVIFQLYALFPLFWGLKQKPKLMFSLALFIQVVTFYLYTWQVTSSDRLQYVLVFSWLAYFVWGIY